MGGFTRILHDGHPDSLMDEIPTFVAQPLPDGIDQGYIVLNRPYGVLQWVQQQLPLLMEDYVLMLEPDHLLLRPVPLMATPTSAAGFPFSYMDPKSHPSVLDKYNEKKVDLREIRPVGNAPVMLHKSSLLTMAEPWYNLSLRMKRDPACEEAFGWILEMYAFAITASQLQPPLQIDLHPEFQLQPPWDQELSVRGKPAYILHFTYGLDFTPEGTACYGTLSDIHWDKRDYTTLYPPRNATWPPSIQHTAARKHLELIAEAAAHLEHWHDRFDPPP
eukprot:jgi/Astpho2/5594/e_gw1.00079.269.1_t